MLTLTHILIGIGVVAGYALLALARPYGTCWRCRGQRMLRRKPPKGKGRRPPKAPKPQPCPVCGGQGYAPTPGAPLVHALVWELLGDRIRQRRRDDVQERLERRDRS